MASCADLLIEGVRLMNFKEERHYQRYLESLCSKWGVKEARSCFVTECVERRRLADKYDELLSKFRSLAAKVGVLHRRNGRVSAMLGNIEGDLRRLSVCRAYQSDVVTVEGLSVCSYFEKAADMIHAAYELVASKSK